MDGDRHQSSNKFRVSARKLILGAFRLASLLTWYQSASLVSETLQWKISALVHFLNNNLLHKLQSEKIPTSPDLIIYASGS